MGQVRSAQAIRSFHADRGVRGYRWRTVEKVFALYRENYFDLNLQHFHEKLQAEHGIKLSYTWVKQALQGAGLVARGRKRGAHRKRRERRPLPGMLLHIDGSRHQWFQDERWYDLIVILDERARSTTRSWWKKNRLRR